MLSHKNDPLLESFTLKGVNFRNRIMSASHACDLGNGDLPNDAYQRYHEEKARGGIALSMFGGSSNIDIDSSNSFGQLNVASDRIIPYFEQFSEKMHQHGAALMCQISHLGRRGNPYVDNWLPTIAPSPIRESLHRSIPKQMDEYDIKRVIQAYALAARRCKDGGIDGIETLASGHLIGQFLSPLTNYRTDKYGGSQQNRLRFVLQVHEAIRKAVGDDFIVGIRLQIDEGVDGGVRFEESVKIALTLKRLGLIDFVNAIYGRIDTVGTLATDNMPGMGSPTAPWLEMVGDFRHEINFPVFHSARITDVATARYAVTEGKVDMVGMTRAHIADPYIVSKLKSGREVEIRPCVGATHCHGKNAPHCLHNAATGRETLLKHVHGYVKPSTRKNIMVIGAGPAGLESARILAERGHKVSVYEAGKEVGGQVLLAAQGSLRKDLIAIIDWRVNELKRLNVPVFCNSYMEEKEIVQSNPDVVICSTGGVPLIDIVKGEELCIDTWDILSQQTGNYQDILIYDGTGRHPGPLAAEHVLKSDTNNLTYITIDSQLGQDMPYVDQFNWKSLFLKSNINIFYEYKLHSVTKVDNKLEAKFISEITMSVLSIKVDHVVIEQGTIPIDDVFDNLRKYSSNNGVIDLNALVAGKPQSMESNVSGFELYNIGDAVSSRNIHAAILDATRLCNSL